MSMEQSIRLLHRISKHSTTSRKSRPNTVTATYDVTSLSEILHRLRPQEKRP